MIPLIENDKEAIAALCRRYRIRRLDLFGSAATGSFDPETSDVDFIVDLGEYGSDVAVRYLDFTAEMEELLGRRIDMLTERSIQDRALRRSIEEHRSPVYAAKDSKTAA